jgi:hypothetical protein
MPQQKGMKRAAKVLKRSRKLKAKERNANFRRMERVADQADQPETEDKK